MEKGEKIPESAVIAKENAHDAVISGSHSKLHQLSDAIAQTDTSKELIEFLQTKESSQNTISRIIQTLKSANAPQPMIDLIERDFAKPLEKSNDELSEKKDTFANKIPIVQEQYKQSKQLHQDILGFDVKEIRVSDEQKRVILKHAVEWVCQYSAKKVCTKTFDFQRKLLVKEENIGNIQLNEEYIKNLGKMNIPSHVEEFRKAGWSEPICIMFGTELQRQIKAETDVIQAKITFLKKKNDAKE